jgi:hypothetical protein
MNLRLVDEVYLDIRTARDWYDGKSIGLGDESIRMPRFTAVIYYDLSDSEIVVVGVLVNGRSASILKNRG